MELLPVTGSGPCARGPTPLFGPVGARQNAGRSQAGAVRPLRLSAYEQLRKLRRTTRCGCTESYSTSIP